MGKKLKSQLSGKGFTLAELIIGIVIISAIFTVINSFHSSQLKLFSKRIAKIQLEDDLSVAMMQIEKELITAKNVVYPTVEDIWGNYVEIEQDDGLGSTRRIRWEISNSGELLFWPDYGIAPANYETICKRLNPSTSGLLWKQYPNLKKVLCVRLIGQSRYGDEVQRVSCFGLGESG